MHKFERVTWGMYSRFISPRKRGHHVYLEPPSGLLRTVPFRSTQEFECVSNPSDRPCAPSCKTMLNQSFPEALEAYGEAIELDNTNMSFVSNRAAVFFEQKEYEACIAEVSLQDKSDMSC